MSDPGEQIEQSASAPGAGEGDVPRASGAMPRIGDAPLLDPNTHRPRLAASRLVELIISRVLRGGVLMSLVVILGGIGISFIRNPEYVSSDDRLTTLIGNEARFPHRPGEVWAALRAGQGQAIVIVGLLILLATPILRVAISIVAFAVERDRAFVAITSLVLALLLAGVLLGQAVG